MPTFAVTRLFLGAETPLDPMIDRLLPQLQAGHPVLIWRSDGLLILVHGDPDRLLIGDAWRDSLIAAVNTLFHAPSTQEDSSEN